MAVLGLHHCTGFSPVVARGLFFVAGHGLLFVAGHGLLIAEHGLKGARAAVVAAPGRSSCSSRALRAQA